jgi:hypothetical protein
VRVKHAVAHPHVESIGLEPRLARGTKDTSVQTRERQQSDQHYLAVTSESAGAECEVCRVAAGCQDDLERCISRAVNSNE